MLGLKDLINRYRHNKGFGVQSPKAFHFVTSVLREKHPYYAYRQINSIASKCGGRASHCRMLFRITNYARPCNIIMFAPQGVAACAISSAASNVPAYILNAKGTANSPEAAKILDERGCTKHSGDIGPVLEKEKQIGLLYVGRSFSYASVVEEAIKHTTPDSVIIVEEIHATPEITKWWQSIKEHPAVVVSYDLYSMGILFFDKKYKKQHYTLKR